MSLRGKAEADLRAKIPVEIDLALEAYAVACDKEKQAVVREVLQEWFLRLRGTANLLDARLRGEGMRGILGEDQGGQGR